MKKFGLLTVIVLLIASVFSTGCAKSPADQLLGSWKNTLVESFDEEWTFQSDGTVEFRLDSELTGNGTYKISNNEVSVMNSKGEELITLTLDGNTLKMNGSVIYEKK